MVTGSNVKKKCNVKTQIKTLIPKVLIERGFEKTHGYSFFVDVCLHSKQYALFF